MNGSGGFIYTDAAIVGSVVQAIGGVTRDLFDIEFFFDLDVAANGELFGLERYDNDALIQQSGASGTTFNLHGQNFDSGSSELVSAFYEDGGLQLDRATTTLVAPVPLPGAGLAALAGVGALVGLQRRRKA